MMNEPSRAARGCSHEGRPAAGFESRRAAMAVGAAILLGAALFVAAQPVHAADGDPIAIAVLDFDYVDTSGEVRDQREVHAARLQRFAAALRNDLAQSGKFRIVSPDCGAAPCAADSL